MKLNMRAMVAGAILTAGLGFGATTAAAQAQAGLVNVNVSGITVVLADLLDVNENQIPVNVQAPIGIAAQVCGVHANVLASAINDVGTASCDAQTVSRAFANLVAQQL